MKRRALPKVKQPTTADMLADLLSFVEGKFYAGRPVVFAKHKPDLLEWVILYPARWLNERRVTIPPADYRKILRGVLIDAFNFGQMSKVKYLPAYLRHVVQTHFAMHGEEIYERAKTIRNMAEHVMLAMGGLVRPEPQADLVKELLSMQRVLNAAKGPKRTPKQVVNDQLTLL